MSNIRVKKEVNGEQMLCEPTGQVRWRKPKDDRESSSAFDPPEKPQVLQQQYLVVELHNFVWIDVEVVEKD